MFSKKFAIKFTIGITLVALFFAPLQTRAFLIAPQINIRIVVNTTQNEGLFNFTTSSEYPESRLPADFVLSTSNFTDYQDFILDSFNSYNFTQQLPSGWELDNIGCLSNTQATKVYVNQNSLDIVPSGWESITCIFNNKPSGPSLNPVLFIPGTMGTQIFKDTEFLWPDAVRMFATNNDRFMDPLSFKDDGTPLDTSLSLGSVLDQVVTLDYTKKLVEDFESQNYKENIDLFLFPYDWREDIAKNANEKLKEKIDQIFQNPEVSKLDVVAHSQGGLIIKKLLFDQPEYQSKIGKLVFLGTPHLGSPKAAKALLYGDSMGVAFSALGLDPGEIKRIARNMPSVYQMLPSQEYFEHTNGYWGTMEFPWFSDPNVQVYNYQTTKDKLKADGYNVNLLDGAEAFHAEAYDNFDFSNTGIDTYNIMGCETPTINQMLVRKFGVDRIVYGPGDGTVPIFSASNTLGTNNFYALTTDDLHGKMPSFEGVRQKVVNIITGSNLPTNGITSNPTECKFDGEYVSIHSPVDLHVYDEQGNHVGPLTDGNIEFNIPGVAYDIVDHEKFAFLPKGHVYTLKFIATDNGTFSFHSAIVENGDTTRSAYYSDVLVTASSTAQITLNQNNDQIIQFTSDSRVIAPSSILNAEQSQDLIAPVSSSTLAGLMGQPGFYRSNVSVSLSAIDPLLSGQEAQTSGVLKIQYNLDNAGYQAYATSSPINVTVAGAHSLSFFATDKAGNNEAPQTINFNIDKTAPEFNIQFNPTLKDLQFLGTDNLSSSTNITILDQDDSVTLTDQAGNVSQIILKDKERKKKLKAEIKSLSYNGQAADISQVVLKFNWDYDTQGLLKVLEQHVKSKKDFNIDAVYKPNISQISGKDQSGKVNKSLAGLVIIKVNTNKGDMAWGY